MTVQGPIPDYAVARQAMVESQLRPQGVGDSAVVEAMGEVPREAFVPDALKPAAYSDRSIPLGSGRQLMSPAALGLLLTALAPRADERALVVGAGSGYSAAVLARMGLEVTALEADGELATAARLSGATVVEGSLAGGYAAGAPYDLILIDGAVDYVPDAIVDQIRDGGRLGTALFDRGVSRLVVGFKAAGGIGYHSVSDAGVSALPGFQRPAAFTF